MFVLPGEIQGFRICSMRLAYQSRASALYALNYLPVQHLLPSDFCHLPFTGGGINLTDIKNFIPMGTFTPTHDSKESTTDKFEKLIQGKGYLELMMYFIGISTSLVILFG